MEADGSHHEHFIRKNGSELVALYNVASKEDEREVDNVQHISTG